jgi:hypothetical protein
MLSAQINRYRADGRARILPRSGGSCGGVQGRTELERLEDEIILADGHVTHVHGLNCDGTTIERNLVFVERDRPTVAVPHRDAVTA